MLKRLPVAEKTRFGGDGSWEGYFSEVTRLSWMPIDGIKQYAEWERVLVNEGDVDEFVRRMREIMVSQDVARIPAGPYGFKA